MIQVRFLTILFILVISISAIYGENRGDCPDLAKFRERVNKLDSSSEVDNLLKKYLDATWQYYKEPNISADVKQERSLKLGRIISDLHSIAFDRREQLRQEKADKMTDGEIIRHTEEGLLEDRLGYVRAFIHNNSPTLSPLVENKLLEWCGHKFAGFRCLAAAGVSKFNNVTPPLLTALLELTSDPEASVRLGAIYSLGEIRPNGCVYLFIGALDDDSAFVRTNAHIILTNHYSEICMKQQGIANFLLKVPKPGPRGTIFCFQGLLSVIGHFEFACKTLFSDYFFSNMK